MGSWAAFANLDYPWPAPAQAFFVQGILTAGITILLKRKVEIVVARRPASPWLAPLAAAAVSATLLTTVHGIAGTPAFWATIAVPLFVATSYSALYAMRLVKDG